ncbi:MAG TPA: hypothetical protein VFX48_06855, partial [Saprospiraceae bacterium]|nr:hypothetical protein [Saprospiraceae bacterium]
MKTTGTALQIPEPQKNLQNGKQYFVQLTSLSKSTDRLVDRFRKYAVYGDVYKLEVNGITKIRVGAFSDVNEA